MQKLLVLLDGGDGQAGDAGRPHGPDGGADGVVAAPVVVGGEGELPPVDTLGDGVLRRVVGADVEAGGGVDPAVVGSAGPRAVLVDGAAAVDQHRAVAPVVVTEEVVTLQAGDGEEQLLRDVGQ